MRTLSISRAGPTRAATRTRALVLDALERVERAGVGDGEVLGLDAGLRQHRAAAGGGPLRVALAGGDRVRDGAERAAQRGGALAVGRAEPGVARREREAVGCADRRDDLQRDREVEVADHPAQDRDLLRVLLAEVDGVGRDDVQQLADDRADAVEVRRPALGALEHAAQAGHADPGREPVRVELGRGRGEQRVDAEAARRSRRRRPPCAGRRRGRRPRRTGSG